MACIGAKFTTPQGLRTLLICTRIMPEDEWFAFNAAYQAAAASIDDREQRLAAVAETIETDFELVGVTAIEDKLQEGVPQAITTLVNAGIKVWSSALTFLETHKRVRSKAVSTDYSNANCRNCRL